jgi:hypothetical protein
VDDTIAQSTMPPQIIATEPTGEKLGEAMLDDVDGVASTGPNDAVGAERRKLDRMISPPKSASD